jgi:NAD(P)-dependent dehydrogenase (short-subunit alcohol dehydrogenase family)
MKQLDLANNNAIVTGGAQGIGRAVADKFASNDVRLAIWDLDIDLAKKYPQH